MRCPACGYVSDAATSVAEAGHENPNPPKDGDLSLCLACGSAWKPLMAPIAERCATPGADSFGEARPDVTVTGRRSGYGTSSGVAKGVQVLRSLIAVQGDGLSRAWDHEVAISLG